MRCAMASLYFEHQCLPTLIRCSSPSVAQVARPARGRSPTQKHLCTQALPARSDVDQTRPVTDVESKEQPVLQQRMSISLDADTLKKSSVWDMTTPASDAKAKAEYIGCQLDLPLQGLRAHSDIEVVMTSHGEASIQSKQPLDEPRAMYDKLEISAGKQHILKRYRIFFLLLLWLSALMSYIGLHSQLQRQARNNFESYFANEGEGTTLEDWHVLWRAAPARRPRDVTRSSSKAARRGGVRSRVFFVDLDLLSTLMPQPIRTLVVPIVEKTWRACIDQRLGQMRGGPEQALLVECLSNARYVLDRSVLADAHDVMDLTDATLRLPLPGLSGGMHSSKSQPDLQTVSSQVMPGSSRSFAHLVPNVDTRAIIDLDPQEQGETSKKTTRLRDKEAVRVHERARYLKRKNTERYKQMQKESDAKRKTTEKYKET